MISAAYRLRQARGVDSTQRKMGSLCEACGSESQPQLPGGCATGPTSSHTMTRTACALRRAAAELLVRAEPVEPVVESRPDPAVTEAVSALAAHELRQRTDVMPARAPRLLLRPERANALRVQRTAARRRRCSSHEGPRHQ
jgi:hypothetical protein